MARCRCHGRRPWRPLIGVLRAQHLPLVEVLISSIIKRHGGCVPWRPVLKQVPPWRSQKLAAACDPERTPSVHRSTTKSAVPKGTTLGSERFGEPTCPISYSITSSARSRIDCGTARPSALAVLTLTAISNLVGS
jgi:hypothetical protein